MISFFIASRLAFQGKKTFSRLIIRFAVLAVALGVGIMIIASALVDGFKSSISERIFDFWGHVQITHYNSYQNFEVVPISKAQTYFPGLEELGPFEVMVDEGQEGQEKLVLRKSNAGVKHVQTYISKEGIIKTKDQIEGIILKGVDDNFDWQTVQKFIVYGDTIASRSKAAYRRDIIISEVTAKRLNLDTASTLMVYFVQNGEQRQQKFNVCGIYKTGLEEYDKQYALCDIRVLQDLNNWRPYKLYPEINVLEDSISSAKYQAGKNFAPSVGPLATDQDWITVHGCFDRTEYAFVAPQLTSGKMPYDMDSTGAQKWIAIGASLASKLQVNVGDNIRLAYMDIDSKWAPSYTVCGIFSESNNTTLKGNAFCDAASLQSMNRELPSQVSGFEVFAQDINDIDLLGYYIHENVCEPEQMARTIKQVYPNIFDWLNLQHVNERIIFLLMLIVAVINMITALLILIIERTRMVGLLKALGASNWPIQMIFLYQAMYIVGLGLLFGNLLGLGFCFAQSSFGFITLPEDMYYVSVAPVHINWLKVLAINLGTFVLTIIVLLIPTLLVSKITPVKAISFR